MVEFCSWRCCGGHGSPPSKRTRRLAGRWAAFGVIGAVMTVLAPAKQAPGLASTTGQAIALYFIGSPTTSIHSVEAHAAKQPLNGLHKWLAVASPTTLADN